MPKPRKALVSLDSTPYYHCVSRCVRRAFLCGTDATTGHCYEHRRQWLEDKLNKLSGIFAVRLCAYAVMSNHYHVVLYVDKVLMESWTDHEVVERWHHLFKGTPLSHKFSSNLGLNSAEQAVFDALMISWRERLIDISWFMRIINEAIAREANREDDCSGRFWEGRFKSQALLDEKALAACMAYVDLNPIRAKMAETPETSDHTSAKQRIEQANISHAPNHFQQQPKTLVPFVGNPRLDMPTGLPFRLSDYLELLDWTGRMIRENKRGAIANHLPPILERLEINPKHWLYVSTQFESRFKGMVGSAYTLRAACKKMGYQRTPGINACQTYLT